MSCAVLCPVLADPPAGRGGGLRDQAFLWPLLKMATYCTIILTRGQLFVIRGHRGPLLPSLLLHQYRRLGQGEGGGGKEGGGEG
jgi:hypothetical protein